MADSKISADWYIMAEKDRRSARILLDADGDNEVVCFGAEVGASKFQPTGVYVASVTFTALTNE